MVMLPANKYDWMQEMAPAIPAGAIEDPSGNAALFAFLLLACAVAAQLILVLTTKRNLERASSLILILVALLVWKLRF